MKVGVLTFHSADNFGAVLQAFALQRCLVSQGHSVEIIDYRPKYLNAPRSRSWRPDRLLGRILSDWQSRKFEDFRRLHLSRTSPCWTVQDLEQKLPRYDAVVVGSDQVWSPDVDRRTETDPVYFLRWSLPSGTRKVAYAASFGTDTIRERHVASVRNGLENMDVISVRESTGVKIVKELTGREATCACDPVFLFPGEEWRKWASAPGRRGKDIMVYRPPSMGVLRSLACRLQAKILLPKWNVRYLLARKFGVRFPSPLRWVSLVASSRGVVTKTFHGTAFSILMHTPFVYIRPADASCDRATRVTDLLSRLGLSQRMLEEDTLTSCQLADLLESEIDWSAVERNLEKYREDSRLYLKSALVANTSSD